AKLDKYKQLALYRIAQQALNNVHKHASASEVSISISCNDSLTTLSVADNGRGMQSPDSRADCIGIESMKTKAALLSADFQIISPRPEGPAGTEVRVRFRS